MPHQPSFPSHQPTNEVILKVGLECGSLTINGIFDPEYDWRFLVERDETTMRSMLPEDEKDDFNFHEMSNCVASLKEAIALLDCYPWHMFYPVQVHPDFKKEIFDAVVSRYEAEGKTNSYQLEIWKELCHLD